MPLAWNDLLTAASGGKTASRQAVIQVIDSQIQQDLIDLGPSIFASGVGTTKLNHLLPSLWMLHGPKLTGTAFVRTLRDVAVEILGHVVDLAVAGNYLNIPNLRPERLVREIARKAIIEKILDYLQNEGLLEPAFKQGVKNEYEGRFGFRD